LEPKLAMFFNKLENSKVHCYLCPHNCVVSPDGLGKCRARKNMGGRLFSLNFGKITSIGLDKIEKKPLYNFYPGSKILSVGTFGCNLKCSFCQNWTIAHENPEVYDVTPDELVQKAEELIQKGNIGIAFTYNEPSIWYEFVYQASKLSKNRGLKNVLVTNGFISKEPLEEILPFIDAMNIDVKGFTDSFYKQICKSSLNEVKQTVEIAAGKTHVEVTTLVVPGLNDAAHEIAELAEWLSSISKDIPLHLSRFFPNYKMLDRPVTPLSTLEKARDTASKYLNYVYLGNV
jgi:pyruvate formate lyase activating enzyme